MRAGIALGQSQVEGDRPRLVRRVFIVVVEAEGRRYAGPVRTGVAGIIGVVHRLDEHFVHPLQKRPPRAGTRPGLGMHHPETVTPIPVRRVVLPWRIVEAREVREQEPVSVLGYRSVYAEAQDRGAQAEQRGGGRLGEPCPSVHQYHVIVARPLVARQSDQSAHAFKVRMTGAGVVDEAAAELWDDGPRSFAGGAAERGQDIHGATSPGQLRLAHASLDQLAFGIRTQARLHQPVEYAKVRQVLPRQQQSANAGGFQVEIHHQHIAPALGLVRCENRHGTGSADTALDDEPMVVQCTLAKAGADEPGNVLSALSNVTAPAPESSITVSRCSQHS